MSKKKKTEKRTYTEGETRRMVKKTSDEAVSRIMLLCLVAARDVFNADEDGLIKFVNTMQRYADYHQQGLISLDEASNSLKKRTGIDLRLPRW